MPANTNKKRLILVTGATGQQGGAALRHLREKGFSVRALTRDPNHPKGRALMGQGAEVTRGDMQDQASLTRALDGVYGVFSVQPFQADVESEVREGVNLADAAKRSRITHFVYSSVIAADRRTGIPHFESKFQIEEHIRRTGMHFTILRPVFFMENWLGMRSMIENGTLSLPLSPDKRIQMIAVDDIGGIVAMCFERSGKWQDRTFEIAGDEMSMTDLAQGFARVIGREVRYVQAPWEEFEAQAGRDLTLMYRWFEDNGFPTDIGAVRQEYPKLTTFDRWLNANWHTGARTAG